MKNKYYLLQWTWGFPLTFIGAIVYFILSKCFRYETFKYRKMYYVVVPWKGFGGMNLGMFAILGETGFSVLPHEYGHSIQNIRFGWVMPFVVAIPSVIRYWFREYLYSIQRPPKTGYYDIWFEGQASRLGLEAQKDKWNWM